MMTMNRKVMERRAAKERPEYSFEVQEDEDRHVMMLGIYRMDRVVFAFDLPGKMSDAEIISLGDGLCMLHANSYEDGLRSMYRMVNDIVLRESAKEDTNFYSFAADFSQIGRDLYEV